MIELIKPEFAAGNETRFFDFIKNLNDKDKIALISHVADDDGVICAKIVSEVLKPDKIIFVDYGELNEDLALYLKKEKFNKLVFCDLYFNDNFVKLLENFSEVLVIDHHQFTRDINSDKIVFMNGLKYCASYMAYYLCSKIQDISYYDWLVATACVADYQFMAVKEWLEEIYLKYGDKFELVELYVRTNGKMWDLHYNLFLGITYWRPNVIEVFNRIGKTFGDLGDIPQNGSIVQKEIDNCLIRFDKEKKEVKDILYFEYSSKFPIKSVLANIVSNNNIDKTIVFSEKRDGHYAISTRRQDKKKDMNLFLRELVKDLPNSIGGGHPGAAGGQVSIESFPEFKKRLGIL